MKKAKDPRRSVPAPPEWRPANPTIKKLFGTSVKMLAHDLWGRTLLRHPEEIARKNYLDLRARVLWACILPTPLARREMEQRARAKIKSIRDAARHARALEGFLGSNSLLTFRATETDVVTSGFLKGLQQIAAGLENAEKMPFSFWELAINDTPHTLVGGRGRKGKRATEVALHLEAIFRNYTTDDRCEYVVPLDPRDMPVGGKPQFPLVAAFVSAAFQVEYGDKDFQELSSDRAKRKILRHP